MTELEQAIAQLKALGRLAKIISSTFEVETILQAILQETMNLMDAEQGSIHTLSENESRPMHTLYKTGEKTSTKVLSGLSDLTGGWVLKNRTMLISRDLASDERFPLAQKWFPEIRAVAAVPMIASNSMTGIVILTRSHAFEQDEIELLDIVATQCAQVLKNARRFIQIHQENQELRREIADKYSFHGIIGKSASMQRVFELLARVIEGESRVLIEGESGTGKELIARVIHHNGPRRDHRFVAVDCGALPENLLESELFGHVRGAFTGAVKDRQGLFELADRGTLFLDEISNTSLMFQAKLLRAIQEGEIKPVGSSKSRKVDVRVITASSAKIRQLVEEGEFRQDLYYRLNIILLELPPLRERPEDIRLLAEYYLEKLSQRLNKNCKKLTPETLRLFESYRWPGNVRELENIIERGVTLAPASAESLQPDFLPSHFSKTEASDSDVMLGNQERLAEILARVEAQVIRQALAEHENNRTVTAKKLGITRQTLIAKLKKHEL